jgi:nucleotide-binding universal stress UspA family protein
MAFPFRRIFTPIDFDETLNRVVDMSREMARANDGIVLLYHVVPMLMPAETGPLYVDAQRNQEQTSKQKLDEIAQQHLRGVKYELATYNGDPAPAIVKAAASLSADLIVIGTHGRKGFSRVFLGSVAEIVLRDAPCPVLVVRAAETDRNRAGYWMTANPEVAQLGEKVSVITDRMHESGFRSMPVVKDGLLVGVVTDRDIRSNRAAEAEVGAIMSEPPLTVSRDTPLLEVARLLRENKIGVLPVVEKGRLVGTITATDVLQAFLRDRE